MKKTILLTESVLKRHPALMKLMLLPLLLCITMTSALAQSTVKGTVMDESKSPMPGVNIILKGTTTGTTTDASGQYAIEIPSGSENAILVVSFIGYLTEELAVNGATVLDVNLTPNIETLNEVVVVGYGTQKKSDVTGSIVSVKASDLAEVPVANIQQALQGRAAGVEVQSLGTAPGASARIRIRGERSVVGGNDPLIVLNGIPYDGSLSDINQDDIASLEVLKDASATAIYGSRGANGVVLITTKRGKAGETRLTFSSYYGSTSAARKYKMFNGQEYAAMRDASAWPYGYMPEEVNGQAIGRNTDWQDLMYKKGYITDSHIGLTGGSENSQFSLGVGYFKQTTILPGQDFGRYSVNATIDTKVGQKLKIGLSTLNTLSINNGSQFLNQQADAPTGAFGGSMMYNILSMSPLMPAYETNGEIYKTPAGNNDDKNSNYSPLLLKHNNNDWVDKVRRIRSFTSAFVEYTILDGLKYRLNVGADFSQVNAAQFKGSDSYFRSGLGNQARVFNEETFAWTAENLLLYEKTFAEKHKINFTGLYSAQQSHRYNTLVHKDSITTNFTEFYNLGAASSTAQSVLSGGEESWGLISNMARLNYSFNDRFLATLTYRRDGSSRLANKYHSYYAAAVGWNIMNESFMKSINVVTNLKLRAGYGGTSNQAVTPYTTLGGVTNYFNGNVPIKYNYGTQHVNGYISSRLPDKKLDWEYTNTTNIGLDFGILNNRITGTIDWYKATTKKLLYNYQMIITTGYQDATFTNQGSVENKGLEIAISSVNVKTPSGFTWNTDFNWFYNRNKLTALTTGVTQVISNGLFVGQPLTAIYDYKKLGIWQTDEAAEAATFGQLPGQLKLADINGPGVDGKGVPDGQITSDDRTIIGSQQAKWQAGMTNRFTYKGFDLSIVAFMRYGGLVISGLHGPNGAYLTNLNGQRNGLKVDYWTPTNPTNEFPAPSAALPINAPTSWTTLQYYDATFLKIRSINFGYTLPKNLISKIKAQSVRVYVTAQNPFLLFCPYVTKHNGVDPEASGQGSTGVVANGGNYRTSGPNQNLIISATTPPTRSFLVGLNISF